MTSKEMYKRASRCADKVPPGMVMAQNETAAALWTIAAMMKERDEREHPSLDYRASIFFGGGDSINVNPGSLAKARDDARVLLRSHRHGRVVIERWEEGDWCIYDHVREHDGTVHLEALKGVAR